MYGTIKDILSDLSQSELLDLVNDEGMPAEEIIFDEEDENFNEENSAVVRIYDIIGEVDEFIDSYLIGRYKNYLPLNPVPKPIKGIAVDLYIYELKKRRKRENMPESLENIRKTRIKDLEDYQKGVKIIDVGSTESKGMAAEVQVNKTSSDRIFDKDTLDKF